MQYCPFCGLEFPNNARFCGRCGHTPAARVPANVDGLPGRQASFPQTGSQTSSVYQSAMGLPPASPLHTAHSGRRAKKSRGSASKAVSGSITKWVLIAFIFIIIAGSASAIIFVVYSLLPIGSETSTPTGSGNGSNHSLVDLTFSGALTGHMSTEALVTICKYNVYNGTKAYYFNVKDVLNGKKYDFFVSIYPYTGSGTYTERNVAAHLYYQTEPHGTVWNLYSPYIFKITDNSLLNTQGTVDAELSPGSGANGPVHISGNWRCSG